MSDGELSLIIESYDTFVQFMDDYAQEMSEE